MHACRSTLEDPTDLFAEDPPFAGPYDYDEGDPPITPVLRGLAAMEGDDAENLLPAEPSPYTRFAPSLARSMWLRSDARAKREVLHRLGATAGIELVRQGLAALAALQESDGSFEPATGRTQARQTAVVLLAFLSDGHSSRSGEHRAVVEKGVGWLRAAPAPTAAEDRAVALLALAEDFMLSSGSLTPAESRARYAEIEERTRALKSPGGGPATGAPDAWSALAISSAARLGIGRAAAAGSAPAVPIAVPADGPEIIRGTALLLGGRVPEFQKWNDRVVPSVVSRLAVDGLARGAPGATQAERVEETALALLALQVSYRTY